ncbi:type II toxin-antitoxin system RelE/ParE family toxin [Adhaeribacter arboris]|uniref:Type II toxin-antitoxin system RelE/ParE family toxin n=1 Tax=Adhaeribacter arboris TaxID=2072846 RepID=A0A2T2YFT1_9BACT|nr:type II toxin-antitoxin system RelE/ParE family toxin [Adhaeribacter arboris]
MDRQAIENIHETREYFSYQSRQFADQLTDKLFEKTKNLEHFPQIGRIVPEIDKPEIRELIFRNYQIVYLIVSDSQIDILAVHNGFRPLKEDSLFD